MKRLFIAGLREDNLGLRGALLDERKESREKSNKIRHLEMQILVAAAPPNTFPNLISALEEKLAVAQRREADAVKGITPRGESQPRPRALEGEEGVDEKSHKIWALESHLRQAEALPTEFPALTTELTARAERAEIRELESLLRNKELERSVEAVKEELWEIEERLRIVEMRPFSPPTSMPPVSYTPKPTPALPPQPFLPPKSIPPVSFRTRQAHPHPTAPITTSALPTARPPTHGGSTNYRRM